jgi:two-component system KDP operon response regulator KdpE
MNRVLLVCDDPRERRQLPLVLRHGGFDVKVVRGLKEAGGYLRRNALAAVLVTDLDGVDLPELVADLRDRTDLPILVVSQQSDEPEKVAVLDAGADDYLTQPVGIEEMLAHLRASVRRFARAVDDAPIVTEDFAVYVHDRRIVRPDGSEVRLTSTEWKIVEVLLQHNGHLVSQPDLLRAVWGPDAVDKTQYLRVHMVSIRRKVEPDPSRPRYFLTVPGLGLRFVPAPVDARGSAS